MVEDCNLVSFSTHTTLYDSNAISLLSKTADYVATFLCLFPSDWNCRLFINSTINLYKLSVVIYSAYYCPIKCKT